MAKTLRVAAVQFEHAPSDKDANLRKIREMGFRGSLLLTRLPAPSRADDTAR